MVFYKLLTPFHSMLSGISYPGERIGVGEGKIAPGGLGVEG